MKLKKVMIILIIGLIIISAICPIILQSTTKSPTAEAHNIEILEKVKTLQNYAEEYKSQSNSNNSVALLCVQYITKDRYTGKLWEMLLGEPESGFINYLSGKENVPAFKNEVLMDPITNKEIDFVHMIAPLNVYIKNGDEVMSMVNTDYSGWAGDLLTLLEETTVYRTTNNITDKTQLQEYCNSLMGTNNNSTLPSEDMLADLDAKALYKDTSNNIKNDLYTALYKYYVSTDSTYNATNRLETTKKILGTTKDAVKNKAKELLTDTNLLIIDLKEQLFLKSENASKVTSTDIDVAAQSFANYIYKDPAYFKLKESSGTGKIGGSSIKVKIIDSHTNLEKASVQVENSTIANAEIEGEYVKITPAATGTTKITVYSDDKTLSSVYQLTVTCEHTYEQKKDAEYHWKECSKCGNIANKEKHKGASHETEGKCTECQYQCETHGKSTTIKEYANPTETTHIPLYACTNTNCTSTYEGDLLPHEGATHANGGICEKCKYQYQSHSQSTKVIRYESQNDWTHKPIYECTYANCTETYEGDETGHRGATHTNGGICDDCKHKYENHSKLSTISGYKDKTATTHTPLYLCAHYGCLETYEGTAESHEGATHANGGKCTACEYQYETHGQSTTVKRYESQNDWTHKPIYECTFANCTETYEGDETGHRGATHANGGICDDCKHKYENHSKLSTISGYKDKTATTHTPLYLCAHLGCLETFEGTAETHEGATHEDGKCKKCEHIYQKHEKVVDENAEIIFDETGHKAVYKCSFEGCTAKYEGTTEAHTGGTHENQGKCTVCEYQYQVHSKTTQIAGYTKQTETTHTALHGCTFAGCNSTYEGKTEEHTGGTHDNQGKCTTCEYQYQVHSKTTQIAGYTKQTATTHTALHGCTFAGCNSTYEGKTEEHTGGTHENEGECTVCQYQYQEHGKGEFKEYDINKDGHLKINSCKYEGCEGIYEEGTREAHKGATHENGGKCTVCKTAYEKHEPSEEVSEYLQEEEGHTPVYKCTIENCKGVHKGTIESHEGGSHKNEGVCTTCNLKYQIHEKSSKVKEYTKTETAHTPKYECSHPECKETYTGETENHTGATHVNDGKCMICEYQYEKHGKTTKIVGYNKNEENHTPQYACSHEKCTTTYAGKTENHKVTKWSDTKEGVHSGNCEICEYKLTQEHNYGEDGLCIDCSARIPEGECNHVYQKQNNETHHWKVCKKCEGVKKDSLEEHKYETHTENEDNETHSAICTECEYEFTEEHIYEEYTENEGERTDSAICPKCNHKTTEKHTYGKDGLCTKCKARISKDECTHSYAMKNNKKEHWEECVLCLSEKDDSKEKHTYANYVDNNDGTHSGTCTVCKHTITEEHTEDDAKCSGCVKVEQKPGEEDNAGSGNEGVNQGEEENTTDDKKDDTTVKNEIPKAGIQSVVLLIIFILGVTLVVAKGKLNKYKDI